jgi:hypothetical protein
MLLFTSFYFYLFLAIFKFCFLKPTFSWVFLFFVLLCFWISCQIRLLIEKLRALTFNLTVHSEVWIYHLATCYLFVPYILVPLLSFFCLLSDWVVLITLCYLTWNITVYTVILVARLRLIVHLYSSVTSNVIILLYIWCKNLISHTSFPHNIHIIIMYFTCYKPQNGCYFYLVYLFKYIYI